MCFQMPERRHLSTDLAIMRRFSMNLISIESVSHMLLYLNLTLARVRSMTYPMSITQEKRNAARVERLLP